MISNASRCKRASSIFISTALLLILAFNVLGNLYWVRRNIVLVGHDASAYLQTSVEYADFLKVLSPQTVFHALTVSPYRPPALFIVVQPFYWLFGVNMHSAQGVNLLFLVLVIWLTFALGKTIANQNVGLFAALLVGLFPMMMAMARLFYTEMFLTAMVALNLLALYRCQFFTHRRWSMIWGMSLGVGLLVKWTMPIYVALPLLWILWRASFFRVNLAGLQRWRVNGRAAMSALLTALIVSALWFWPNRIEAQTFPLGNLLYIGWVLILGAFVYALLQPASPIANGWTAALLALVIASLWYLPHANFVSLLLYEDQVRGQASASALNLENYLRYFRYLYNDHFGMLAFWLVLPAALFPWFWAVIKRKTPMPPATLLWLSLLSAYLVLSLLAQRNPRNLVPLLPGVAVLATLALQQYPRRMMTLLGCAWVVGLVAQWGVFTFDSGSAFYTRTHVLWADSDYLRQPASNETNPAYWIGPSILDRISDGHPDVQSLGMLVNMHQLHPGTLNYLRAVDHKNIELTDLTGTDTSRWANLLSSQWVLLKNGDNGNVEAGGQTLLQRIRAGDPLFTALYTRIAQYLLPNGETVSLYHRAQGPGHPQAEPALLKQSQAVAEAIRGAWSAYASLIYATGDLAVWVGLNDPSRQRIYVLDTDKTPATGTLTKLDGTLLVVLDHNAAELEAWLDQHAYRTIEIGDDFAAVAIYGRTKTPLDPIATNAAWQNMHLSAIKSYVNRAPGQVLPLETQMEGTIPDALKMSVRLLAGNGTIIASHDRPILPADRFGLFIPPDTAPGTYQVVMLVYNPTTLAAITNQAGKDVTPLLTVSIDR
jgi:4-amino-4-deoxy-L-arabinose transferase-like glycosyltransferase